MNGINEKSNAYFSQNICGALPVINDELTKKCLIRLQWKNWLNRSNRKYAPRGVRLMTQIFYDFAGLARKFLL